MTGNSPLGIGIVGAGFVAESHAAAIATDPRLRLSAVFDLDTAAAAAMAARFGAARATDLTELLGRADVEAVIVCTPNDTHVTLAEQVAEAGRHLLMEKPLALSSSEARRLTKVYADRDLTLLVGHTHRHSAYAIAVKEAIESGRIGTVRSMRLAITGGWIWGGWGAWVLDPARSGGHAFHNGVHLYDLARWWLDSPVQSAWTCAQHLTAAALRIDDYLCSTLQTESGAAAVCEISRGERPRAASVFEIVVQGTRGTLLRTWSSDGIVRLSDDGSGPLTAVGDSPFGRQLVVFEQAIRASGPVAPPPEHAVEAIAVAEAVERSARTGDLVRVGG
ncbi:MAG: Gfo/Idh/MocA family protein [Nocardioidaceae bacterium]